MSNIKQKVFDSLPDSVKVVLKDVAEKIKEYNAEFSEAPVAASAAEGALKDGTPFKYTGDTLAQGSIVTVVAEGGEVPMPDGEYILPDDSVMVVANDGTNAVVSEIKPVEGAEMNDEAKNIADVKERVTKIVEKFEAQFKSQETENKKLKLEIESLKLKVGKQAKLLVDTFSVVEAFGEVETGTPAEKPLNNGKLTAHQKKMNLIK